MSRPKGAPRGLYDRKLGQASSMPDPVRPRRDWGRKNIYVCDTCHGAVVTEDVDHGTTPMFLACRVDGTEEWDRPDKCSGTMQSQMYPREPWPEPFKAMVAETLEGPEHSPSRLVRSFVEIELPEVEWEWYHPSGAELRRVDGATLDHVRRGGLLLRKRADG